MEEFVLGLLVGNVLCYFTLVRPIIRLKDDYIERLNKRLERLK